MLNPGTPDRPAPAPPASERSSVLSQSLGSAVYGVLGFRDKG